MPRALDSLDFVEVIMEVERHFRIDLPDHVTAELHLGSAADLWRVVRHARNDHEQPHEPPPQDPLWLEVRHFPIKEFIGALVTLTVAALGYLQWRRTNRSGRYIEDREAAALREFGRLLGQIEASAPPRHELALTAEGVAMPPELQAAYEAYESARRATIDSFRSAIGAGQI